MKINVEDTEERIDKFLNDELELSRSKIQKLIKEEKILVNNNPVKNNYTTKDNDEIEILDLNIETSEIKPEDIKLDIVYEDEYLLVVNKVSGMVVHPAPGHYSGTLVNALMFHSNKLSKINGNFRPGIVHRIDKDTSGLLVVAKDDKTHNLLADMLKKREIHRYYKALVWGIIQEDTGQIDAPIGRDKQNRKKMAITKENSKNAVTNFTVLERYEETTLIECKLDTGRTHQIRVHMEYINHPIVNDNTYTNKPVLNEYGQLLHAYKLEFIHPITNKELSFEVPLPKQFEKIIKLHAEK